MTPSKETKFVDVKTSVWVIVFFLIPFIFGVISLLLGKDINWDLKNYHYYNAYAFLENRLDFDIAPAQLQTFINPIADIPFYWMAKSFPAWVAGFVLGFLHGFNLSLIFLIFLKITKHWDERRQLLYGLCLVAMSGLAPGFISELGNTMHDNLTSVFVLCALFLLIMAFENMTNDQLKRALLYTGIAGLIMGLGVGIKPAVTIFAISSAIVLGIFQTSWRNKVIGFLIYGVTGIVGGVVSAGFWWWEMWRRFGNPFFPFYNDIFKSSYFTSSHVSWSSYSPVNLSEYFLWPMIFSLDSYRVNQFRFLDIRFALLYLLFIIWPFSILFRKLNRSSQSFSQHSTLIYDPNLGNCILLFFVPSYILWLRESATYRFLIPLELLAPLCFLILVERLLPSYKAQTILAISAALLTILLFRPFNWGRVNWSNSFVSVDTARFDTSKDAIVIMLGRSPTSYVIPELPANFRFVRPEGNLFTYINDEGNITPRDDDQRRFIEKTKNLLDHYAGNVYILFNKAEQNIQPQESLLQLGMRSSVDNCFILKVNTPDQLEFCQVLK